MDKPQPFFQEQEENALRENDQKRRREKLRTLFKKIAVSALLAAGLRFSEDSLRNKNIAGTIPFPEGNIIQVATESLDAAMYDAFGPDSKDIFLAWTKFNGMEIYARHYNMPLAGEFIKHFLSGDGSDLDITSQFIISLRNTVNKGVIYNYTDEMKKEMTDEQLLVQYIRNVFHNEGVNLDDFESGNPYSFARTVDESGNIVYHTTETLDQVVGKTTRIFQIEEGFNDDINKSLGRYTVSLEGVVKSVDSTSKTMTFAPGANFSINDTYDWKKGVYLSVSTTVGSVLIDTPLKDLLPEKIWNSIATTELRVRDDEGAILIQTGFATPFDVTANYQFNQEITIPYEVFEFPPTS